MTKRVLCYQTRSGLGDFFLALPAMLALQEIHPSSVFVTPDPLFNFFEEIKVLKQIVPLASLENEIKKEGHYNYTLDFANVMFKGDSKHPYLKKLEFDSFEAGETLHASEHYFRALKEIEPKISKRDFDHFSKVPFFDLDVEESFFIDKGLVPFKYFTVHAGAGYPYKVWEKRNFEECIELLLEKYPSFKCVVVEGPTDPQLEIKNSYNERVIVFKSPLEVVAKILYGSLFHLDNDSGVHHLAGLLDIPSITIFGPTGPGTWRSLSDKNFILWGWNNCGKPCDYISVKSCHNKVCLSGLTATDVVNVVPKALEMYN